MNTLIVRVMPLFVAVPCFLPAVWRLSTRNLTEHIGLFSDLGLGLAVFAIAWYGPRWFRILILVFWAVFQAASRELLSAVGRLPSWQDVHYLFDLDFLENSSAGMHLADPVFVIAILVFSVLAASVPLSRPARKGWGSVVMALMTGMLLFLQVSFSASQANQNIVGLYNPLHWFVADTLFRQNSHSVSELRMTDLPLSLRTLDLEGKSLLGERRVKNVLIITLEGISGIYNREVRQQMGVPEGNFQMMQLAEATQEAMHIPDFITHSHQTIRGLYSIHCGDISKLSFETPKALELQLNPERSRECLPAQLAQNGWETHFLQGANLQFMNKDKVMPSMGFLEVHGLEWFPDTREKNFVWGTSDKDFFLGARKYVHHLQQQKKPWLLSLLTVATHQPFDASEELVQQYGSRKIASVAKLDKAAGQFIKELQEDGVLEETLVIITSDESHGAKGPDWFSSWGFMAVLAPYQDRLPRLLEGTFGLVDIEASILDYLDLPMPPSIIGRSFFREYTTPRDMVAYTAGKLRWQMSDNRLYECGVDGNCRIAKDAKILSPRSESSVLDTHGSADRLFGLAALLDHKLTIDMSTQILQFANGEIRLLPEKMRSEWADNLVGAQYLDFPKNSRVEVDIRLKAVAAGNEGVQLKLVLRQFEKEVDNIIYPSFPLLQQGEDSHINFSFENPEARKAFSFHLVGEGLNSSIQLEKFEVAINRGG